MRRWLLAALLGLAACSDKPAGQATARAAAPEPLPSLVPPEPAGDGGAAVDREAVYRLAPAPVYGQEVPGDALRLELAGEGVTLGGQRFTPGRAGEAAALKAKLDPKKPLLLVPDEDTFLVQAAPLLALLDDAGVEPWLLHPSGQVAYQLVLRDEPAFQAWMAEPRPGKVRVIQRADGYEVTTNIGKLPGADPNGPSVPLRGGQADLATLRRGLTLVQNRFKGAKDFCVVPSFGTELQKVAATLSAGFYGPDAPTFEQRCLVYPRPTARDGG